MNDLNPAPVKLGVMADRTDSHMIVDFVDLLTQDYWRDDPKPTHIHDLPTAWYRIGDFAGTTTVLGPFSDSMTAECFFRTSGQDEYVTHINNVHT